MIVLCETRLQFYWNWHCSGTRVNSARQKLEFVFIAELSRAKRASGAP